MDHILQLNEFFVEGGRQETSHVLLHITEPSTPEEMEKGYFFAICEINNAETKYIAKLQDIIDRAENDYYELPDELGKTSLELVLEKINQEAYSLIKPDVELHCILGAIRQPEIIFTFYGKPELLLFYKNRQGLYQKMDLLHDGAEEPESEPSQLFSQLIQGKISPDDFLFAGTPHIVDYFNHDRLEKIITSRPALQSAQHLERVLTDLRNGFSFGGLIIHLRKSETTTTNFKKIRPPVIGDSTKSLHNLFGTEQNTANTLSASLLPRLMGSFKAAFKADEKTEQTHAAIPNKETAPAPEINSAHVYQHRPKTSKNAAGPAALERLQTVLRFSLSCIIAVGKGFGWVLLALYTIIYSFFRFLVLLVFVASNHQNRRQSIIEDWRRQWRSHKENIRQLPTVTKMLLLASILVGATFIGSIVYLRFHQQKLAREAAFQTSIQLIKNKKDAVESALIYKDQSTALSEFQIAQSTIDKLNCISQIEKTECTALQKQLNELATRLKKVTTVIPEMIVDTSSLLGQISLEGVIKINTKLIAYSKSTSTLVVYDTQTKQTNKVTTFSTIPGFSGSAAPKENDYLLLSFNKKEFIKFDPTTESTKIIDISYPNDKVSISGSGIYNRRLYVLDTKNNQIYKHDTIKTGFGQGKEWIKDMNASTTLADGVDLSIDGDVYILKNTGQIAKFASGVDQPFSIAGLYPSLSNGGKLWTYNDVNYLYIIDGPGKRLLIVEKDGRLRAQITAKEFQNPSGLAIDTVNKNAYITDGTKLYKINLPQ